ncbi:MAG: transporter [Sphingomicrobium sp.]
MRALLATGCALLASTAAHAEDAAICTDRPAKGNSACTVPAGKWQLETSPVDWLQLEQGDSKTETLLLGGSLAKLGLTDASDVEVAFTPVVRFRVDGSNVSGFGDVTIRFKQRLTATDSAIQFAVIPFVKLPTAKRGIGNGKIEGGVALPISFALAGPVTATLGPEVDLLADADGHGRHPAIVQLVNLSAPIAPQLTLIGELWANWNFGPDATVRQASVDVAAAYAASLALQLDVGANVGLTRATPDLELYAGLSARF